MIIQEFLLDSNSNLPQTLYLPNGTELLAGAKETSKGVSLFALVNPLEESATLHTFEICAIGDRIHSENIYVISAFESALGTKFVVELKNNN